MPPVDIRELLPDSRESPLWDDVADRCLTCGNCTMVCPTCFCTTTEDRTDLTGEHAERSAALGLLLRTGLLLSARRQRAGHRAPAGTGSGSRTSWAPGTTSSAAPAAWAAGAASRGARWESTSRTEVTQLATLARMPCGPERTTPVTSPEQLAGFALFDRLTPPQRDHGGPDARRMLRYCDRHEMFDEGQAASGCWLIQTARWRWRLGTWPRPGGRADLGPGDVLGWSWLVPPHHWQFAATTSGAVSAVRLETAQLRTCADADPAPGLPAVARAVRGPARAAAGHPVAAARPVREPPCTLTRSQHGCGRGRYGPDGEPMLPVPYRVTARRVETRDSVTLRLEPAGPARCRRSGRGSSPCCTGPASARSRSRSAATRPSATGH